MVGQEASDQKAERAIRWACIGTGHIAMAMAQQLSRLPGARREAICSASGKPAAAIENIRAQCGYARALTFDELIADGDVDIVYVASANSAHAAHCLAALRAGKPVLCEKPLTLSLAEAEEIIAEAVRPLHTHDSSIYAQAVNIHSKYSFLCARA